MMDYLLQVESATTPTTALKETVKETSNTAMLAHGVFELEAAVAGAEIEE